MTVDRIVSLAYIAAKNNNSLLDESSVDQWRSGLLNFCETSLDYQMFEEAVFYIYDAIRVADDSQLDARVFIMDLYSLDCAPHDQDWGSCLSCTGTTGKPSWTSFAPFGHEHASNSSSAHGHHHQQGEAAGSGQSGKGSAHKRSAPDDGADPGSSKRIALAADG